MGEKRKILVVEDNPVQLKCIELLLSKYPFEIHSCTDAESAAYSFAQNEYDLVISDYNLPGKSGVELSKILRGNDFLNPIVLFTGNRRVCTVSDDIDQSIDMVVYKPCTKGKISMIMENYMGYSSLIIDQAS